jgi:hypothetical protein
LSWEQLKSHILAPVDDRSNALKFDICPSKEHHESGSTDESTEELEHVIDDYEVSFSDLTDDEFIRSLYEHQTMDDSHSKESDKYSSTDKTTEELEHVNEYHKVSYSDLTDDEFIRSLFEDQNDMHADRHSREISYFMDSHLRDTTIDTLDQSKEMETTDNLSTMQNTFYDNEEISNLGYKGILFKFNH